MKLNEIKKEEFPSVKTYSVEELAKKHRISVSEIEKQLKMGTKVEKEHTKDKKKAREIALDHILEDPKYYTKLHKMENE